MTKVVAIGAGHGLGTPGKRTPDGEHEWSFNNKVVLAAIARLKQYEGIKVVRMDDPTGKRDIPLNERTNKANAAKADVLVSIHHNALTGKWGQHTGTETYTYLGEQPGSTKLAKEVQPRLHKAYGLKDRGIKQANFHMVRESNMPAILTEGGYMDSNIDIKALRDDNKLRDAGVAIADGIAQYFGISFNKDVEKPKPVIVNPSNSKPKVKTIDQMAQEVIAGKHGNGHTTRRKSLGISQAEYDKVSAKVNAYYGVKSAAKHTLKSLNSIAQEVIDGKWGNGSDREKRLNKAGYNADKVQVKVNQLLSGGKPTKSIDQMAREVIDGKHGNGNAQRQKSLGVDNTTYQKVRARVNQLV